MAKAAARRAPWVPPVKQVAEARPPRAHGRGPALGRPLPYGPRARPPRRRRGQLAGRWVHHDPQPGAVLRGTQRPRAVSQ